MNENLEKIKNFLFQKWVRRTVIAVCILMLVGILLDVLSIYRVSLQLAHDPLSPNCTYLYANDVRSSQIAFNYAQNQSHWANLSNFMNAECNQLQIEAEKAQYPYMFNMSPTGSTTTSVNRSPTVIGR